MTHVLIIDDEPSICWGLAKLAQQIGLSTATAATAEQAFQSARHQRPDVILLDVRLPGMDGLSAMEPLREVAGDAPIVVMTAYGDLATAVQAVRNGAFDYLVKPFELGAAERAIRRAVEHAGLPPTPVAPAPEIHREVHLVGSSPGMQDVFRRIALVAPSEACVHLRGESGTGKELVARAIHHYSRRAQGPFVAVNIAALSPTLAESELFGHVRGAFTGADQSRKGLLERADGGTLFFDEVADIPLALQVKLLRALEHGEILPVGADHTVRSDFRVLSATHQDLRALVARGAFRHDLYFRLVTFEIQLPPLRERREDIRELAEYFLETLATKNAVPRPTLTPEALAELQRRPWHGNLRELRNAIEHAAILAPGGRIAPEHLPPPSPAASASSASPEERIAALVRQWAELCLNQPEDSGPLYERLLALVERPLFEATLAHYQGQYAAAARRLGLHRTTLKKKLEQGGGKGPQGMGSDT